MVRARSKAALALVAFAAASAVVEPPANAADWPHWRGPHRDGTVAATDDETRQPVELALAWSRPLGVGYSGISVADGLAVTMYSDKTLDHVVALDAATGETRWSAEIDTWFPPGMGSKGGPKSTPAIEDGVVYALGPKGHLLALDLRDGTDRWRAPLHERLDLAVPDHGFATSPVVSGDLVVIQTGGAGGPALTAVDKRTGEIEWTTDSEQADFQTPVPTELAGVPQILSVTNRAVRGVAAATGATLWSWFDYGTHSVPTPILLGDDRFLLPGMYGSVAFRVALDSRFQLRAEHLWKTNELKRSLASPVLHEGYLYGFSDAFLVCVSAADGKRAWKSRSPGGHGLIGVDDRLVVFGKGGTVVVVEATPDEYREQARIDVFAETGHAYPAYADGRIFVRNLRDIAAVSTAAGSPEGGRLKELGRMVGLKIRRTFHRMVDWVLAEIVGPLSGRERSGPHTDEGRGPGPR